VTINQKEGVEDIRFRLDDTVAFEGTPDSKGQKLQLKDINSDRNTRTISLTFESPVPPGKTVTIGLKPSQNPAFSGVYLFGVTVYPSGEKPREQFLGYGRLQFYDAR
jgi:hypothetical protein